MNKRKLVTGISAAVLGSVLMAAPAFAHVTVNPNSAPQGSTIPLSFQVPNEEDNASTTKVEINFPTDHPITTVTVQPVPGWTDSVETTNLPKPITTDDGTITSVVSKVTWSGGQITPGHFQQFIISADSLPTDTNQIEFKAVQTYSNGDVVRWIDDTVPGQPEPDHPAPVLKLTPASQTSDTGSATTTNTNYAKKSSVNTAVILGVIGIVLGAVALFAAMGAARKKS